MAQEVDRLITSVEKYARACLITERTASTRLFGRSSKLQNLRDGGDITTASYRRAMERMRHTWPHREDAPLPEEVSAYFAAQTILGGVQAQAAG